MIRSSMSASLVALVILLVRAYPLDHDDACPVRHRHLEPVRVALHVEDHHSVRQEACARATPANLLRLTPRRALDVGEPVLDPAAGIVVLAAEPLEPLAVEYFHPCLLIGNGNLAGSSHFGNQHAVSRGLLSDPRHTPVAALAIPVMEARALAHGSCLPQAHRCNRIDLPKGITMMNTNIDRKSVV